MSITEFPSAVELREAKQKTFVQNVTYIGPTHVDREYLQRPAEVPRKVEIADLEKILDSAVQRLFEVESKSFVSFMPPPMHTLKDLFRGAVLPRINSHHVIATLDQQEEEESDQENEQEQEEKENISEIDKILALAYTILGLEDVHLQIRLAMKSLSKA